MKNNTIPTKRRVVVKTIVGVVALVLGCLALCVGGAGLAYAGAMDNGFGSPDFLAGLGFLSVGVVLVVVSEVVIPLRYFLLRKIKRVIFTERTKRLCWEVRGNGRGYLPICILPEMQKL